MDQEISAELHDNFCANTASVAAELAMRLTFEEAAISEGFAGCEDQCSADIFVNGNGGHNKIVALIIVSAMIRPSETPIVVS
jgi:hypothetical protein